MSASNRCATHATTALWATLATAYSLTAEELFDLDEQDTAFQQTTGKTRLLFTDVSFYEASEDRVVGVGFADNAPGLDKGGLL